MPPSMSDLAKNHAPAVLGGTLVVLVAGPKLYDGVKRTFRFVASMGGSKRFNRIDDYNQKFAGGKDESAEDRNENYSTLVDSYYDLATEFYEWGWGQCFHFADRRKGESFWQSILRHEYYLAGRLGVNKNGQILDCGCGVGGPARNISKFTNAKVTGITINQFQVDRANTLNRQEGLYPHRVEVVQGDFMQLPFAENSFDAAYAIEATCHAPDRVKCFSEIYRVLKPGATFACYEWCVTDLYDDNNPEHRQIKHDIAEGDGLPDVAHTSVCDDAIRKAGFELIEARDCATDGFLEGGGERWHMPLMASWKPWKWPRFQFNPVMSFFMPIIFTFLEACWLVPKGTCKTQLMLKKAAIGLTKGADRGLFTAMYLIVARKPN
eukprot:TRINITY_DN2686_c0_g1_i1.p1 TRINITY_DN2686_c0_g1~~TRINITY_DN2686_c0_g1_i1.p1  ORF type:complete len:379 (+),score=95.97 TRINITY_DN2686_c0_g1_i1:145-1281(+)